MKHYTMISCLLLLAACNHTPAADDPFEGKDPLRPVNEQTFAFNLKADQYVIRPTAQAYHHIPPEGRASIDNVLTNLSEPNNVLNGILQRDPQIAFTAFWRFTLNTTFGFGGIRDFAGENGLKNRDTNFGKTLGSFGIPDGPYLVLPLAGPSTARDTAGLAVDWFLDPVGWFLTTPESLVQMAADAIDTRDQQNGTINQFYYQSLEPYTATRAGYLQHQAFQ